VYDKILELYRAAEFADGLELASVLSSKAALLRLGTDEDMLEAQTLLKQAYGIYNTYLGPRHIETAHAQLHLALTHFDMDEYIDARPLFSACLDVFREVAGSRVGMASLRGHFARRGARVGLSSAAGSGVTGSSEADAAMYIPDVLNCLGSMTHAEGDSKGARALYTEALRQYMDLYGEIHPDVAKVLNNFAALMDDNNEVKEAQELYEHSLHVLQQYYGRNHVSVAVAMENLGNLIVAHSGTDGDEKSGALEQGRMLLETAADIRDELAEIELVDVHPAEEEEVAPPDDFLLDFISGVSDSVGAGAGRGDDDPLGTGCVVM